MSDYYISRESVLNTIEDMDKALDTDRTVEEYKSLLIECVKVLPSRDSITELEKIKAEFEDRILLNQTVAIQIMDKHIAELKGENNPDCRNCDKWKTCENGEKGHANGTSIGYSIGECRDYVELKGEQE